MSTDTPKPVQKAVKSLEKLLGSKKADIRLQAAQTLLSYSHLHADRPYEESATPSFEDNTISINDALMHFAEWLDGEGLIRGDNLHRVRRDIELKLEGHEFPGRVTISQSEARTIAEILVPEVDKRSHTELAAQFIKHWNSDSNRAPLPGVEDDI